MVADPLSSPQKSPIPAAFTVNGGPLRRVRARRQGGLDSGNDRLGVAEIGDEQALRDRLLIVLGPVPDLAHAVERPDVREGGTGSNGRVGVEADRLMGAGSVRDAVAVGCMWAAMALRAAS